MEPVFYNQITVGSSGYYFYQLNNFVQFVYTQATISSQSSCSSDLTVVGVVLINEQIDAMSSVICNLTVVNRELINANINVVSSVDATTQATVGIVDSFISQFSFSSNAKITATIGSGADVSTNTTVSSSIGVVYIIDAGILINSITQASVSATVYLTISSLINSITNFNSYNFEIFNESIIEDSFNIIPFFILDNLPLSEHNRTTSFNTQILNIANSNWRGAKSVYYKKNGVKKTFTFQWRMLPGKRENTVDNNLGRDFISTKASEPYAHVLQIRNLDTDGGTPYTTEVYNVLVTDYSENLVRRDLVGDDYYWDCNLSLQEI